jgi:FkbM family methyltransferase
LNQNKNNANRTNGPKFIARVARSLRSLAGVRGWTSIVNWVVPNHQGGFIVRNGKTNFAGNFQSFIDRQVYLFGGYEQNQIYSFISCIPQNSRGIILDIGANAGTHSLAFAQIFKNVHSFEPNPLLWPQFERNMSLNSLTNVNLHKVGLADKDAELVLHMIDKPNYGLGTFSTKQQYDLPLREVATCSVRHGGKYLAEIKVGKVDAIKVDVQGFEPEVLRGLSEVIKTDHPVIWCEIGEGTSMQFSSTEDLAKIIPFPFRCLELMERSGILGRTVALQERCGKLSSGNYVLVPKT